MIASGHTLTLLRPDDGGRLVTVASTELFGLARCLLRYRLHGQEWDHLLLTGDAGSLTALRWDAGKGAWAAAAREVFGRSGVRRAVPGALLAGDPRGRAVVVAAAEKAKLAYLTHREGDALALSSPLEAHRGGERGGIISARAQRACEGARAPLPSPASPPRRRAVF